jgi:hypothetical protein
MDDVVACLLEIAKKQTSVDPPRIQRRVCVYIFIQGSLGWQCN